MAEAWMNAQGVIYRQPKFKDGLKALVFAEDLPALADAERYQAFRADILTKHQPVMSAVAEMLQGQRATTTPAMVDAAFDAAMKRFK